MSDKIIAEIVLEGEKEAIASIQRVGKAADATFADLQNVQLNFGFIKPEKGLKSVTDVSTGIHSVNEPAISGRLPTRSPSARAIISIPTWTNDQLACHLRPTPKVCPRVNT